MIEELKEKLRKIKEEGISTLKSEKIDRESLKKAKVKYLGRKGLLNELLKQLSELSPEERREIGRLVNETKALFNKLIEEAEEEISFREAQEKFEKERIDVTAPGKLVEVGYRHPLNLIMEEIKDFFFSMNFSLAEGPEIEDDYHNFEALNIPKDHPARDMHDTLFITDNILLRTHTSPVQIRTMLSQKPPVRIITMGRCYRRDAVDSTHSPMFHQVEGLLVDKGVSMGDLKGIITAFVKRIFGKDRRVRFRPSFFPFTEPSAEVDVSCGICGGKGCRACGYTGWLEIMGAGMVDPEVFKAVGYNPSEYTGFAFGMGIERIAMLKYNIDDIRLFYDNDLRFLRQFRRPL